MKYMIAGIAGIISLAACTMPAAPVTTSTTLQKTTADLPDVITLAPGPNLLTGQQLSYQNFSNALLHPDPTGSSVDGLRLGTNLSMDVAHAAGVRMLLTNDDSALPITIAHHSTNGGANSGNWITTRTGADLVLMPGQTVVVIVKPVDIVTDPDTQITTFTFHGWAEQHDDSVYGVSAEASPSRSIGTAWQPNAARPTMVIATMSATCELTAAPGEAGRIDLLVGSSNPPTTVVGSVPCANTGIVVVGVASTVTSGGAVTYLVKPGDFVEATTTDTTGSPAYTLSVVEETL